MVSKGKQVEESDSLGAEFTPRLKGVFIELKGVYYRTWIKKGITIPLDCKWLARWSDEDEDTHSAIMSSFSSNTIRDLEVMVNMVYLPDEFAKRLEKQEQWLKQQEEFIEKIK